MQGVFIVIFSACLFALSASFPDGRSGGNGGGNVGGNWVTSSQAPAPAGGNFHNGGDNDDHTNDQRPAAPVVADNHDNQHPQTTVVVHDTDHPQIQHVAVSTDLNTRFHGNTKFINDYHDHPERYTAVTVPDQSYGDWRDKWHNAHLTDAEIQQLNSQSDWYGQWQYLHGEDATDAEWQAYLETYGLTPDQAAYAESLAAAGDQADLDVYMLSLNLDYSSTTPILSGVASILAAVVGK